MPSAKLGLDGRLQRTYVANQPWSSLGAQLEADGTLRLESAGANASVRLVGVGRGDATTRTSAPSEPVAGRDQDGWPQLAYRRPGVDEWYVNGADGLHQWFRVHQAPATLGGPLSLRLSVSGLEPVTVSDDRIELRRDGRSFASYSGIRAWDATGRELPSRLMAAGGRIELRVDDTAAQYPVTIDPTWVQSQKLSSSNKVTNNWFGTDVDIDGDFAVVGERTMVLSASTARGAAYIFKKTSGTWALEQRVTASDGLYQDYFGNDVAISGSRIVVGAYNQTPSSPLSDAGAAYVYVRDDNGVWTQEQKLTASDIALQDNFGQCVDIEGDRIIVSAHQNDYVGTTTIGNAGSVYVFERSGSTWSQVANLWSSAPELNAYLGQSIALSGDTIIAGAYFEDAGSTLNAGSAYIFTRDSGGTWSQAQKLVAPVRAANELFGRAVAIDGDLAIVGAYQTKVGTFSQAGAAYVFHRSDGVWSLEQKINHPEPATSDYFAQAVAISGDRAIIGAYNNDPSGVTNAGATYFYKRDSDGVWSQESKVTASDKAANDGFGLSVSIDGTDAIIGAYMADFTGATDAGAAYVFSLVPKLTASFADLRRTGGKPVNLTLSLDSTSASATVVSLSSNNANLTVPSTATIAAGETSVQVACQTSVVNADVTATVTATVTGQTSTASIQVHRARVGRVDLAATELQFGKSTTGTVTLNGAAPTGGLEVTLAATPNDLVTIPATVTVPAGQTRATFPVTALATATDQSVSIAAMPSYIPKEATLTVKGGLAVTLTAQYPSMEQGATSDVTVTLSEAAPTGGYPVAISCGGSLTGPATTSVAEGETTATFQVQGVPGATGVGTVTVNVDGRTATANVTVVKPVLTYVNVSDPNVSSSGTITGTAVLERPAPASGVVVYLSSIKPGSVTMPATVTIPAGETSATFTITAETVTTSRTVTIVGKTLYGGNRGSKLTINP